MHITRHSIFRTQSAVLDHHFPLMIRAVHSLNRKDLLTVRLEDTAPTPMRQRVSAVLRVGTVRMGLVVSPIILKMARLAGVLVIQQHRVRGRVPQVTFALHQAVRPKRKTGKAPHPPCIKYIFIRFVR